MGAVPAVDPVLLLLAAASGLQACVLLVLVRRLGRQGGALAVLEREVALWRDSCLALGRRVGPAEAAVFAERRADATHAAARGARTPPPGAPERGGAERPARIGGAGAAPGNVVPLPRWLPEDASDEEVALAAGIMRGEAHLANRLRRERRAG